MALLTDKNTETQIIKNVSNKISQILRSKTFVLTRHRKIISNKCINLEYNSFIPHLSNLPCLLPAGYPTISYDRHVNNPCTPLSLPPANEVAGR